MRGPNIVPPPEDLALPETLEGHVVIVVEDDVSTGDMAPDGALGMSLWSNIPECAKYMFRRQDPNFHDRPLEWGGGFIVGGHNYEQNSSREHAALKRGTLVSLWNTYGLIRLGVWALPLAGLLDFSLDGVEEVTAERWAPGTAAR